MSAYLYRDFEGPAPAPSRGYYRPPPNRVNWVDTLADRSAAGRAGVCRLLESFRRRRHSAAAAEVQTRLPFGVCRHMVSIPFDAALYHLRRSPLVELEAARNSQEAVNLDLASVADLPRSCSLPRRSSVERRERSSQIVFQRDSIDGTITTKRQKSVGLIHGMLLGDPPLEYPLECVGGVA